MPLPSATVKEQYNARRLSVDAEGYLTGTRVIRVEYPAAAFEAASAEDKDQVDSHVLSQTGINRWNAYPGSTSILCQTAEVSNAGAHYLWDATYTYSNKFTATNSDGGAQAAELQADGLDTATSGAGSSPAGGDKGAEAEARPYTIRSIKRTVQEVLEFDRTTGRRITNTAGDPFDPPPMTEKTYIGYEVTFFRYASNLRWTGAGARPDYMDLVNHAAFKVWGRSHAAGTLRVADVSASQQWDKGAGGALVAVFEIRVELLYKPSGWKRQLLNQGLREYSAGKLRPILDASGQPITEPVPLNAGGTRLTAGAALVYVEATEYLTGNLVSLFT